MQAILTLFDKQMPKILGEVQKNLEVFLYKPLGRGLNPQELAVRRIEKLINRISPDSAWLIDDQGNLIEQSRMKISSDTQTAHKIAKATYIEIFKNLNHSPEMDEKQLQSAIGEFTNVFGVEVRSFLNSLLASLGKIREMKFGQNSGYQGIFPIRNAAGKTVFLAVFVFERDNLAWKYVQRHLKNLSRGLPGSKFFAFTDSRARKKLPEVSVWWKKLSPLLDEMSQGKRVVKLRFTRTGKTNLVIGIKGEELGCNLFSIKNDDEILLEEGKVRNYLKLYLFGMIFITTMVTGLLSQKILAPLGNLLLGLNAINVRDFRHRIPEGEKDEFGALINTFNEMIEGLDDLEVAKIVQECFFPNSEQEIQGVKAYGRCKPATQIGGDYFDYFPISPTQMGVIIGDVSGHGVSSAIVMSMAKAVLSHPATGSNPAGIMSLLNQMFWKCLKRKK
ncbi:HAMP domain-containing protein, partial [bacterium]|nr:HAMP domain-containing protein [bacterium]